MGCEHGVICKKCGHRFTARFGGGLTFHLLHCDRCGKERVVWFRELGELHLRYLKGLDGPYCVATTNHDRWVQENYPGEPIGKEEYLQGVERFAGKCICGGKFRFDASPRCPKCGSDDFEMDPDAPMAYYD